MNGKQRISHYATKEDSSTDKENRERICTRVKEKLTSNFKNRPRHKAVGLRTRILADLDENHPPDQVIESRADKTEKSVKATPTLKPIKRNLPYHVEAAYAAHPTVRTSSIIRGEIAAGAREFRSIIIREAAKKKPWKIRK